MSLYKELNDVKMDLSEFEQAELSDHEQKRVLKRVKKQISSKKHTTNWYRAGIATALICVISVALTLDKDRGTIASMPFIGEAIEKYISQIETLDYSSYKTAIGESAENAYGKLTLNEIMMDDRRIYLSATYEPADHIDFDYRTYLAPTVKINGVDYTDTMGGNPSN